MGAQRTVTTCADVSQQPTDNSNPQKVQHFSDSQQIVCHQPPTTMSQIVLEEAAMVKEFAQRVDQPTLRVSQLFAGYDNGVPKLVHVDASGEYADHTIVAIGADGFKVQDWLFGKHEVNPSSWDMNIEEAISEAIHAYDTRCDTWRSYPLTADTLEMAIVNEDGFRISNF